MCCLICCRFHFLKGLFATQLPNWTHWNHFGCCVKQIWPHSFPTINVSSRLISQQYIASLTQYFPKTKSRWKNVCSSNTLAYLLASLSFTLWLIIFERTLYTVHFSCTSTFAGPLFIITSFEWSGLFKESIILIHSPEKQNSSYWFAGHQEVVTNTLLGYYVSRCVYACTRVHANMHLCEYERVHTPTVTCCHLPEPRRPGSHECRMQASWCRASIWSLYTQCACVYVCMWPCSHSRAVLRIGGRILLMKTVC